MVLPLGCEVGLRAVLLSASAVASSTRLMPYFKPLVFAASDAASLVFPSFQSLLSAFQAFQSAFYDDVWILCANSFQPSLRPEIISPSRQGGRQLARLPKVILFNICLKANDQPKFTLEIVCGMSNFCPTDNRVKRSFLQVFHTRSRILHRGRPWEGSAAENCAQSSLPPEKPECTFAEKSDGGTEYEPICL